MNIRTRHTKKTHWIIDAGEDQRRIACGLLDGTGQVDLNIGNAFVKLNSLYEVALTVELLNKALDHAGYDD